LRCLVTRSRMKRTCARDPARAWIRPSPSRRTPTVLVGAVRSQPDEVRAARTPRRSARRERTDQEPEDRRRQPRSKEPAEPARRPGHEAQDGARAQSQQPSAAIRARTAGSGEFGAAPGLFTAVETEEIMLSREQPARPRVSNSAPTAHRSSARPWADRRRVWPWRNFPTLKDSVLTFRSWLLCRARPSGSRRGVISRVSSSQWRLWSRSHRSRHQSPIGPRLLEFGAPGPAAAAVAPQAESLVRGPALPASAQRRVQEAGPHPSPPGRDAGRTSAGERAGDRPSLEVPERPAGVSRPRALPARAVWASGQQVASGSRRAPGLVGACLRCQRRSDWPTPVGSCSCETVVKRHRRRPSRLGNSMSRRYERPTAATPSTGGSRPDSEGLANAGRDREPSAGRGGQRRPSGLSSTSAPILEAHGGLLVDTSGRAKRKDSPRGVHAHGQHAGHALLQGEHVLDGAFWTAAPPLALAQPSVGRVGLNDGLPRARPPSCRSSPRSAPSCSAPSWML
jgi:hypothetical protein